MFSRLKLLVACSLAIGLAPSAMAKSAISLAPINSWNVEWSDRTCTLVRTFGDAKKPSLLWIEKYAPTDWFQLNLISNDLPDFNAGTPVWLTLGTQPPFKVQAIRSGRSKDGRKTLFVTRASLARPPETPNHLEVMEKPDPGLELSISQIKITVGGREIALQTGQLYKPFAELRKCTKDIVTSWGLDPTAQAKLARLPQPKDNPSSWFRLDDFPERMLGARKEALIIFRLMIDTEGRPTACEIQRSFNEKEFDDLTCLRLMQRGRFEPARDALGTAVPSYYTNVMHWII